MACTTPEALTVSLALQLTTPSRLNSNTGASLGHIVLPMAHLAEGTYSKVLPQNVLPDLHRGLLHVIGLEGRPLMALNVVFVVAVCFCGHQDSTQ